MSEPSEAVTPEAQVETTFKDVRWERNPAGRLRWHNDDQDRWIVWRPGQDSPPPPSAWVKEPVTTPLTDERLRAGWKSPYRLVPVFLVVLVVVIGAVQALRQGTPGPSTSYKAAQELSGRCLAIAGTSGGQPIYEAGPLACSSRRAAVKVVTVLPGTPGHQSCPGATSSVRLTSPGVRSPPVLCVAPLRA